MNIKSKTGNSISRRKILPLIGSSLIIPFLGFSKSNVVQSMIQTETDDAYQILLKSDGTTVKVKKSDLNSATIVKRNTSTKSLLNWIHKKI